MKKILMLVLAAALALGAVACSDEKKVGSGIDVEKLSEKSKALGEIDEKKSGGGFVDETPAPQATVDASAQNDAAAAEAAKAKAEAAVKFNITSSGYDPYYIRVFTGGVMTVTNKDTKPRSVVGDKNEFDSGPIAPGKTWTYEPTKPGKFNFHDGTRPFVVGTLEVLAR
jgi:hypothetical protein